MDIMKALTTENPGVDQWKVWDIVTFMDLLLIPVTPEWSAFGPFKKAGANVVLHFQENSGHELGYDEFSAAKDWLPYIPKNSP